jgi:hypothetical protein
VREAALAWAARGFKVFRCLPGRKEPAGEGWRAEATDDALEIDALWGAKDYNVGVLCNDMIVVDCDVKGGKPGLASYLDLELPGDTLAVRTPTGGVHYYLHGPSTRNRASIAPGVDVRSFHGYVLAPGSKLHPGVYNTCPAGGAYTLWQDALMEDCPAHFVEQIGAPRERQSANPLVELDSEANVALAIEFLEDRAELAIEGEGGDHTTYAAACGVRDYGVSEDLCYELMLDHYNDRCDPPWEPDHLRVKVENAYTYGSNAPGVKSPEHIFEGVEIPEPEYRPRQRRKAIRAGDKMDLNQQWLFYQRMPRVGTAMLVAPSQAGKTFLAFELARCLATGDKFFRVEPDETCGAVVLAGEGLSGIPARMETLGQLPISTIPTGQLGDKANVKALLADIGAERDWMKEKHGARLGLIVIDTLTAVGLLQDENNNSECGAAVKTLEALALGFNCVVLVIHHPPKNGTGARGGGALHAGFDVVWEIAHEKGNDIRYLECTKNREGRAGPLGSFTLVRRIVGYDDRGREVTTNEVSMGSEPRIVTGKQPASYSKFETAIECARVEHNLGRTEPVPRAAARVSFGTLAGMDRGNASRAFDKCLEWALNAKVMRMIGSFKDGSIDDQVKKEEET